MNSSWRGRELACHGKLQGSGRYLVVQQFICLNLGLNIWILALRIWVCRHVIEIWRHIFEFWRHIFEFRSQNLKIESFRRGRGGGGWVPQDLREVSSSVSGKNIPPTPWLIAWGLGRAIRGGGLAYQFNTLICGIWRAYQRIRAYWGQGVECRDITRRAAGGMYYAPLFLEKTLTCQKAYLEIFGRLFGTIQNIKTLCFVRDSCWNLNWPHSSALGYIHTNAYMIHGKRWVPKSRQVLE